MNQQAAQLRRRFPSDFVFGVATSAYQIEGSPLADGAGPSNWHQFCNEKGRGHIALDHDGNVACDHYCRYQDDVRLMAELGIQAYRFSIAWGRILPDGVGQVNQRGLDFYRRLLDTLAEQNIRSMATLFHWDLPLGLANRDGWANPDSVQWFENYARILFEALDDRVAWWATINEPWVVAHFGYVAGTHPPAIEDCRQLPTVSAHMLRAHAAAVRCYREVGRHQIGLVVNLGPQHAATERSDDHAAAVRADAYLNRQFLQPAVTGSSPAEMRQMFKNGWVEPFGDQPPPEIDFVGVNYYTRQVVRHAEDARPTQSAAVQQEGKAHTEMGWEVYPPGLTETLKSIQKNYGDIPTFVTENGAAFDDRVGHRSDIEDTDRATYYETHLQAAADAISAGVNLKGYFAWSFLDNFEWTYGFTKRFGIVGVDYETQRRIPKASAKWYQSFISATP